MENTILDKLDRKILGLITHNARISFLEVARICNISGAAVHQRVQKMMNNDIITGSEFTLNLQKIGFNCCAFVKLEFKTDVDLSDIANELKDVTNIAECHQILNPQGLMTKIYALSNSDLHKIIKEQIEPLGLIRSEVIMSFEEAFCRQISIGMPEEDEIIEF